MEFIKDYHLKKKINRQLRQLEGVLGSMPEKISKIACIVDMDVIRDVSHLQDFIDGFSLRPENYILLGYKKKSEETHLEGIPFLTDKEINWQGKIRNYHADRLVEQDYDLLINYFDEPKLPLLLLSSSVRAKLRIGVEGIDDKYNDITIACKIKDEVVFAQEVKKVLKTIKSK